MYISLIQVASCYWVCRIGYTSLYPSNQRAHVVPRDKRRSSGMTQEQDPNFGLAGPSTKREFTETLCALYGLSRAKSIGIMARETLQATIQQTN